MPEARGRDRHCVQPDVVSSAVRGLLSVPQASRLQVARLGRARSAASARRQVSICRRNRGAAWHWRQALQWRRRCDEGKSIGDAGAGRSLKSSESRMQSVPEGKQQGQRQRQTPLSGRDKRQKARVINIPEERVMSILQRRGKCQRVPEARGRDRHCVQPDVVSSAVRGLLSVPQASRLQVARLGRARSAASARRQVSICRRNRGAAWHWRQALQWRRRCDEGKSIGDAGAGRSLKSSESRMQSVPEGKQQGQRQRQTPLSGRDKRQKARVINIPEERVMSILQRRGKCQRVPEARGRDRHCVQPDVVSSAVRGLLSVPQASRLQVARLGRARSAASARRQVSICRRNRGAAWHWRQALQWRRRCDEGKSIGDAGAGRSLKSSESRMQSVPEGKQQGQRHRQTPLSGRDKRKKARVMSILKRRGYCQHSKGEGIQCV